MPCIHVKMPDGTVAIVKVANRRRRKVPALRFAASLENANGVSYQDLLAKKNGAMRHLRQVYDTGGSDKACVRNAEEGERARKKLQRESIHHSSSQHKGDW